MDIFTAYLVNRTDLIFVVHLFADNNTRRLIINRGRKLHRRTAFAANLRNTFHFVELPTQI